MTISYLKSAALRRISRHGGSLQRTLQAMTRYDCPHVGEPRNTARIDWTPLHGVEAAFGNEFHLLRGVVLPPDGVRPGADILRVAVTSPHDGLSPAEVTYLDARWWDVSPMPDAVESRYRPSKRRTRGPRGLPLYRSDNLPGSALATKTMLATQYRMRPRADQEPIAEYYSARDYFDLYAIDDAEPMAALSPTRQTRWDSVRTCARCAARALSPYLKGGDGHRYCGPCQPVAADEWWDHALGVAQRRAVEWARDVLADNNAVLVAVSSGWPAARMIVREAASGALVRDLRVALATEQDHRLWDKSDVGACASPAEVIEILGTLKDRRIISWGQGLQPIARRMVALALMDQSELGDDDTWTADPGDDVARWYAYWLKTPAYASRGPLTWTGDWRNAVALRTRERIELNDEHDRLLSWSEDDLRILREIAAGTAAASALDVPAPTRTSREVYVYPRTLQLLTAATESTAR